MKCCVISCSSPASKKPESVIYVRNDQKPVCVPWNFNFCTVCATEDRARQLLKSGLDAVSKNNPESFAAMDLSKTYLHWVWIV